MEIQEKDFFHGPALTQIVEHPQFKALNKASKRYGHYLVNTDRRLFVKYRSSAGPTWRFTFSAEELSAVEREVMTHPESFVFVILVCGHETICALPASQVGRLVGLDSTDTQWIRVDAPLGRSMRVAGTRGSLRRTVPHRSSPEIVMAAYALI